MLDKVITYGLSIVVGGGLLAFALRELVDWVRRRKQWWLLAAQDLRDRICPSAHIEGSVLIVQLMNDSSDKLVQSLDYDVTIDGRAGAKCSGYCHVGPPPLGPGYSWSHSILLPRSFADGWESRVEMHIRGGRWSQGKETKIYRFPKQDLPWAVKMVGAAGGEEASGPELFSNAALSVFEAQINPSDYDRRQFPYLQRETTKRDFIQDKIPAQRKVIRDAIRTELRPPQRVSREYLIDDVAHSVQEPEKDVAAVADEMVRTGEAGIDDKGFMFLRR